MDKNFVIHIANTIAEQLMGLTPKDVIFSWGVEKIYATEYNEMACLALNVNGRLHKGEVIIAYNEGTDYYEIFLIDTKGEVVKKIEDVDFTQLGEIIDRYVERGDNEQEYLEFCENERKKLIQEICN